VEKLDPIAIYQACTELASKWDQRIVKGEKGENVVYDALIEKGYEITRFPIKKEGNVSIERKKEKLKEPRFPDALARYHGDGEPCFESCFFLDAKYKAKSEYLGIVNVHDYNGYVKFLRNFTVQVPFKIFFYVKDAEQIWVHDLRKPHDAPDLDSTIETMRGKDVYRISRSELKLWKRVLYTD
jgi:hypothetical protein